ncbi:MAG TPA: FtsQ-type POTRA domain-containing protein [Streptosporangiaceae bacterium]|nr:FtsQ-type POTRA domain-containing protein [Streptosporangiaceae bacterium]
MSQQARTWRGRHDPWKAAFFGLAAAALVAGVAWALLGSSFLVVRTVRTTGSAVPSATVVRAAGIKLGTPLIRVDTAAVAHRVEQIRQVQSARVTLSWPDAIVIWTKSRTAVFAVGASHGYDLVDSYGVVLRWAPSAPRRLVLLKSPGGSAGSLRHDPSVLAAGTVVRKLPSWLRSRVAAVRAAGPADVILILRGGVSVKWGNPGHAAAKASEMAILLRTKAGYYDVSDPNTAVTGSSGPSGSAG